MGARLGLGLTVGVLGFVVGDDLVRQRGIRMGVQKGIGDDNLTTSWDVAVVRNRRTSSGRRTNQRQRTNPSHGGAQTSGAAINEPRRRWFMKMRRVFGVKKDKEPPPSINDASDRINQRGENVDQKIKNLDAELSRYKEQIKKTRPGPAQEAVKARAMRILKQKRMYEGQRDMLYNQTFNLDQVAFASEGIKDAQQTMTALKVANKELKGMMKTVKIQDIDNLQDEMMDLMDVSNEIQETLGRSYNVPDDIDEEDLMGELDALEADMGMEDEAGVPSYLQPDKEPDLDAELHLPAAPTGQTATPAGRANAQAEDEWGLPTVPRASIRG
ncbi:hypothetical protein LWI28_020971 [Acer negundo]|uniref:Charged multivesicular body protein 5 n=1 Tax=Acer negundo TaxID=4023 RepID=A0AAD5IB78_ACENE|nr:hypothetical protein LWI28_020971 [Acer negundo]